MTVSELSTAREAFAERAWRRAYDSFAAADAQAALELDDLDQFAQAAMLLARTDDYFALRERAYQLCVERNDQLGAARLAGWIGNQRMADGSVGQGTAWVARAQQHLDADGSETVLTGFLAMGHAFVALTEGQPMRAMELAAEAVECGRRFRDPELLALAAHMQGLLLIEAGETAAGVARLDEAMLALGDPRLSPLVTGIVYCGVLAGCWNAYDLHRASEWTQAMTAWCASQPELANFTGVCKVHRAELQQLRGAWTEVRAELTGVEGALSSAQAAYVRGNVDRLQGRFDDAEEAFQLASRLVDPQPGLALLRLARGSSEAAAAMTRRALGEYQEPGRRVELLFGAVEVLLAVGDVEGAAVAQAELAAQARSSAIVLAFSQHAQAMLDLAAGRPSDALRQLRPALAAWLDIAAPYQEARTRLLVAHACRALGDTESADRELAAARATFVALGAMPDLAQLDGEVRDDLLSPRELEVLRLVATGATNRAIAAQLVLSERTVDRHVSNIFGKLGVSTRAAATAYAFERQLV
ncbi:MAG TPA: LuxR C-terminal-related transcriptional regulator [Nocardioidaceae bacterium]|nr:LuxR C-terminal-related transcriptional regulator [Nocardioidaceae bacterium]